MKTTYIDLPLSLYYYSAQISNYVLKQGYVPLNPFYILNGNENKEAIKTLKDLADETWSFRNKKKFPTGPQRNFLISNSLTIEEII